MSLKYKSPLIKPRHIPAISTPDNTQQNVEPPSQLNSSTYISPLIKPRNTYTTASTPVNTLQNIECLSLQENPKSTENSFNRSLEYDTTSERSFGSSKVFNPSPKGSLHQWRSPNTFNDSSNQDGPSSDTSQEASVCYEHSPNPNKFKKQDNFNNPNLNNKNNDERYYHPSMLEDPWAHLLPNQKKNTE